MTAYFLRRLLLVPITFLAITFMVYAILRAVPGGPIEQAETRMRLAAMQGEGGGGLGQEADLQLTEEALEELERYYALDEPVVVGYMQWLGLMPRPDRTRVPAATLEKYPEAFEPLQALHTRTTELRTELDELLAPAGLVDAGGRLYRPLDEQERTALEALPEFAELRQLAQEGFAARDRLLERLEPLGYTYRDGDFLVEVTEGEAHEQAQPLLAALQLAAVKRQEVLEQHGFEVNRQGTIYQVEDRFAGILQLNFGRSYTHGEPVLGLIVSKFEISAVFGLTGFFITWLICVPLGMLKALKHRSAFDAGSSFVVLLAYSIPGYVLAMILLASVAANGWLPLGGYKPPNIEEMGFFEGLLGRIRYMIIPVAAYVAGSFATMTILMKNSLLENLGQDYVRTALAKGLGERTVIVRHALRNSLIPLTARIGSFLGLLFAGSFLIEKVCNIPGMGLLGYEALIQRDYPVIMGILVFGVLIQLFGNIISDLVWAALDPRIRFGGRR